MPLVGNIREMSVDGPGKLSVWMANFACKAENVAKYISIHLL